MAAKTDFTEQEWDALEKGVTGPGFWMAISDRGFFDTFKEAGALAKHLREAHEDSSAERRSTPRASSSASSRLRGKRGSGGARHPRRSSGRAWRRSSRPSRSSR